MKDHAMLVNFCWNIRHLRRVHKLTQREMADILGISVGKLGKIERMEPGVKIHCGILCRACDYFGYTADELLYENWKLSLIAMTR